MKKPKGVTTKNGIVVSQSKTQGKILHSGAKIDVTLKLDPKKAKQEAKEKKEAAKTKEGSKKGGK